MENTLATRQENQVSLNNSSAFVPRLLQAIATENQVEIVRVTNSVTIADSLQAPTLRTLEIEQGKDDIAAALTILILRTASFFNIGNNLGEDQILELAYLMLDRYPHETFEDFVLMFNHAKSGKYGELYNRLDGQIIFSWMAKYLEEKAAEREKLHRKQKYADSETDLFGIVSEKSAEHGGKTLLDAMKEIVGTENKSNEKRL